MKYIKNLNSKNLALKDFTDDFQLKDLLKRSVDEKQDYVSNIVDNIEKDVLKRWDEAIMDLTKKLDWILLDDFKVTQKEFDEADQFINTDLKKAILLSKNNIKKFHSRQNITNLRPKETSKWVFCWREFRPIEKIWLYIPWGTAPLFSTILMLTVPAIIAWCKDIKMCTPVNKDGKIAPEVLYTAKILWIKNIYKVWWAQAIFAMWYGTKQIAKVDKIFWPWNSFVTEAKIKVSKFCAIDMPAWPSEVFVIADKYANPKYVASDLLSQCEHGEDSQCVLVCNDKKKIIETLIECQKQLQNLPRKNIASESMKNSFAILTDDIDTWIMISNEYAPEHLILHIKSWKKYIKNIINAWSVFCSEYSPESAGDYSSWTNHTLPTSWFAKSYSWIWVENFGKWITFQELTKDWLKNIWKSIEKMAESEWLFWHKNAVSTRIKKLKDY